MDRYTWVDRGAKNIRKLDVVDLSLAERVEQALVFSGLDIHSLSRILIRVHNMPDGLEVAAAWASGHRLLYRSGLIIASICKVDPRWMFTGLPSPAGRAAAQFLNGIRGGSPILGLAVHGSALTKLLLVMPQPMLTTGTCRYCGCDERTDCVGGSLNALEFCDWVDDQNSICSACLETEQPGDRLTAVG